jgi:hypothetical protein
MWVILLGGVILCLFLLLDAAFLCYRDIFSVAKLKYSFWSAAGGASYYVVFSHTLTWVEKYINICHESCSESVRCCSCWAEESAILFLFILTRFSGRTCIFMLYDGYRQLVRHFRGIICPSCWIFKFGVHFLICWCLVSVWPIVGQYVSSHW